MGRKVRCKITGEYGSSDDFVKIDGKYYKSQEIYDKWRKFTEDRTLVIDALANIIGYEKGQVFPTVLTKKLKEFEFYGYDVVLRTIEKCTSSIEYSIRTKNFTNDANKISYIMAIIQNNINDVYAEVKREEKLLSKQRINNIEVDAFPIEDIGTKSKPKDISDFLED